MNIIIKAAFKKELNIGKQYYAQKLYYKAFPFFERSHILGQKYVVPHTISHLWMLKIGFKTKNIKEIIGQLIRIPMGIIGSLVGIVPIGNTGGSDISITKSPPIPKDLREIIESDNNL